MTELDVMALVLTHRRPRLASQVVRGLIEDEGLDPSQILLVVNGEGGLEDRALEDGIRVLQLDQNLGPAGGFARGLKHLHRIHQPSWIYVCEDDVSLQDLPGGRLRGLVSRVEALERDAPGPPVGAVGTSGWDVDLRTGRTSPHVTGTAEVDFEEVGYSPWRATLVSGRVLDAGVFPDEALFWWAEELDFSLRVRTAGFRVVVDVAADRQRRAARESRARSSARQRPSREDEAWCSYYMARNPFLLRRRFGTARWTLWHLLKSARRLQLAPTRQHRVAIVRGLIDGCIGRTGRHAAFTREVGEW